MRTDTEVIIYSLLLHYTWSVNKRSLKYTLINKRVYNIQKNAPPYAYTLYNNDHVY